MTTTLIDNEPAAARVRYWQQVHASVLALYAVGDELPEDELTLTESEASRAFQVMHTLAHRWLELLRHPSSLHDCGYPTLSEREVRANLATMGRWR